MQRNPNDRRVSILIVAGLCWLAVFIIMLVEKSRFIRWWPILLVVLVVYGAYVTAGVLKERREHASFDEEPEERPAQKPKPSGSKEGTVRKPRKNR